MTDYEMTKHCAEILGLGYVRPCEENPRAIEYNADPNESAWMIYCPLDEDGEALELVKRFDLAIDTMAERSLGWCVWPSDDALLDDSDRKAIDVSLNRAIVKCVAKVQVTRAR